MSESPVIEQQSGVTRRGFVFGISAAAGGLFIGALPGRSDAQAPAARELTAWVVIEPDDAVVIRVARSDMGQGIFTALPMLVAEELECDWSRVRPEYASPAEHVARNRVWGNMVTTDSVSVRTSQDYLRKAGAQARAMLVAEAAARWNCPTEECNTRNSVVSHRPSGRSLRYGELAEAAARRPVPAEVRLKPPQEWQLIGTSVPQFDTLAKVSGQPIYAIDVRLPGMLYAAISACPALNGKLVSFDAQRVMRLPGVRQVVPVGDNAVAVVAASWWQAKTALDALPLVWDESAGAGLSSDAIRATLLQGLDAADAVIGRRIGEADAALASAARVLKVDYEVPYLAHATMEPQTCTAHVVDGRAEVWAPTQNGEGTLAMVARTLGIEPSKVIVHKCHLGGGFGRRGLSQDWARQAVLIAKAVGKPVKMIWTRQEDFTHDHYRPMVLARQTAGFDAKGNLLAWKLRLCGSSIAAHLAPQWMRNGQDLGMMNGLLESHMFYDLPGFEVSSVMRNNAVPVGFWRGVNYSQNSFFREAFIDEIAHAGGHDPYQFRRRLLAGAPRSLAVLDEAARRAGWGRAPAGVHQGIAVVEFDDAVCAQVVELSVSAEGAVTVHRVVCAIDAVHVVHPDTVAAQMEGCILQGIGAVLNDEITLKDGKVQQSNFHDYPLLRIHETPRIETWIVKPPAAPNQRWGAVGETGLPPLAPAMVNALFAATGQRIRSLPLKNLKLRRA
ncbi:MULTISPECIES: molybdopterin cofactor-binding domain-containing protein [unclassified Variovorax]|jgi:isoquinoline 1-oxidoreductase beta subunit|uniref:xanthine dehydrogenase family protein molybdopterin-binding subunit n=1 Tax=unclassified Variovorax TaxID=663243 RepID=UPI000F7DD849|nr:MULTISPECIES: molybdopterin cofactor-binding domain-containing protein [unclassified Variovorax]RSZ39734.1 xanthine dehydrogenase family protein molybdopterin-binding subunit [Variovorax sp. 553]RSZ40559.1 xanthine dehydrogenase family protein molybdopterin-binding subunit [Variovorax sp. 679]